MIVRVPASSANLGPGFDALGMALSLHLELALESGDHRSECDDAHPAVKAFHSVGGTGPVFVSSPIPSSRGLGFSGAARVAGLVAGLACRAGPEFDLEDVRLDVLHRATVLEGHADNAAASLYGGVVATAAGRAVTLPLGLDPTVVVWVPGFKTSTDESRGKIRRDVRFEDAVFNIGRTALLVAALAAGDVRALGDATEDRLHQDLRFALAPQCRTALECAMAAGAWCGWLSGSGPSVAALCPSTQAEIVARALPDGGSTVLVLRIDHAGAVIERE